MKKVRTDVNQGKKKKAQQDIKTLLKADKKFDREMKRCQHKMPKKKKK